MLKRAMIHLGEAELTTPVHSDSSLEKPQGCFQSTVVVLERRGSCKTVVHQHFFQVSPKPTKILLRMKNVVGSCFFPCISLNKPKHQWVEAVVSMYFSLVLEIGSPQNRMFPFLRRDQEIKMANVKLFPLARTTIILSSLPSAST